MVLGRDERGMRVERKAKYIPCYALSDGKCVKTAENSKYWLIDTRQALKKSAQMKRCTWVFPLLLEHWKFYGFYWKSSRISTDSLIGRLKQEGRESIFFKFSSFARQWWTSHRNFRHGKVWRSQQAVGGDSSEIDEPVRTVWPLKVSSPADWPLFGMT